VLVLRIPHGQCAVPLTHVVEVLRPLPVEPLAGAPAGVLGVAVIRGRATPVVDLAGLLHGVPAGVPADSARHVTLRMGDRVVAIAVEAVSGIRTVDLARFEGLPPLWQGPRPPAIAALGTLDRELLFVLETARLLPADAAMQKGGGP
jgi:purine-binding chemotaxis protein CheW